MRVRNRPGRTQQARIFCSKALLLTQEQERKSAAERGREEERNAERGAEREREAESRGREQRKRRRERGEETKRGRDEEAKRRREKRGSARTLSLIRRIILRLGRVTP